jgi:hypothetical protein
MDLRDLVPGLERPGACLQAQDTVLVLDRDQVGGVAAASGVPSLRQPGPKALRGAEALLGRLDARGGENRSGIGQQGPGIVERCHLSVAQG